MNKILLDQIHSELDNGNIDWNKLYTLHGQFIKEQPSELIEISKHNLEICKLNNKILSLQQDNNLSASDEILIDELNPLKKKIPNYPIPSNNCRKYLVNKKFHLMYERH